MSASHPTVQSRDELRVSRWIGLIAIVCWCSIVVHVDGIGSYPDLPDGPGLTADEYLYVSGGLRLIEGMTGYLFGEYSWSEIWSDELAPGPPPRLGLYLADHPPLGRIWLGLHHNLVRWVAPPVVPEHESRITPWVTACARVGSATAFAILVYVIGSAAGRWYGPRAAVAASLALILMPRAYGHAHLAALETVIGLSYCATVIHIARTWKPTESLSTKTIITSGVLFGLTLLTKIQAVFIAPVVAAWCLWHWKWKSIRVLAIWGGVAAVVFFVGWPWLWRDPIGHFIGYFARTTDRLELYVWYLGEKIADRDVPWHYVPLMFLLTIPVGHLLLGGGGFVRAVRAGLSPHEQLLVGSVVLPMLVLSKPGIAVYDGARLFLVAFPLVAIFVGRGVGDAVNFARNRSLPAWIPAAVWGVLVIPVWSMIQTAPCYLSYYSVPGNFGMDENYWGDAMTRSFLRQVAESVPSGATIHIKPVMHPGYPVDLISQSPALSSRGIQFIAYDDADRDEVTYWLIYRRNADLTPDLRGNPPGRVLAEVRRNGVQLAALIERAEHGNR